MTTEDDFQRMLDKEPDDHHTRLVLADWLDERGDPRGPGYRALGFLRKYPARASNENNKGVNYTFFCGSQGAYGNAFTVCTHLPNAWCEAIVGGPRCPRMWNRNPLSRVLQWVDFNTRREIEDAAALAFTTLPGEEQEKILAEAA